MAHGMQDLAVREAALNDRQAALALADEAITGRLADHGVKKEQMEYNNGGQPLPVSVGQHGVSRLPARALTHAGSAFQGVQKSMRQKRLIRRHQGIPGCRRHF